MAALDDHVEAGEDIAALEVREGELLFAVEGVGEGDLIVMQIEHGDEVAASETDADQGGQACFRREGVAEVEARSEAAAANISRQIPRFRAAHVTEGGAGGGVFRVVTPSCRRMVVTLAGPQVDIVLWRQVSPSQRSRNADSGRGARNGLR